MYEICVSVQFRAIDALNRARGFTQQNENAHVATAACIHKSKHARNVCNISPASPQASAIQKILSYQFETSHDRKVTKRLLRHVRKWRLAHNFGHPTSKTWRKGHSFRCPRSTKWRKGGPASLRICVAPQVLDIQRTKRPKGCSETLRLCVSPQFWTSDKRKVTKKLLRHVKNLRFATVLDVQRLRSDKRVVTGRSPPNPRCGNKRKTF